MKTNKLNDSADVYSSYIFSTSNRSLSKYGERLLMEVISVAQEYTIDAALGIHKLNFGEKYNEKFAMIDIPVKNLLNADDTTNYTKAKEAALELMKIYHTVEMPVFDEDGNQKTYKDGALQYQFASYHLLDKVYVNQKPGIISVKLGEDTWSQILDMGKGYTRYNLQTAKHLDDVVAIRLFQILSNQREPLYFSIDKLKGILGMQDKYVNNAAGFIRRVILPAEEEIKEKCMFEVVHEVKYEKLNGKGRPSMVGLTFSKVHKPDIIKNPVQALGAQIMRKLHNDFGFDSRGITNNMSLFRAVIDAGYDLMAFLDKIKPQACEALKPQGYVVMSLRNLLEEQKAPVKAEPVILETEPNVKAEKNVNTDSKRGQGSKLKSEPKIKSEPKTKTESKRASSKTSEPKNSRLSVKGAEDFANSGLEEL